MYFPRSIEKDLAAWYEGSGRKPLILRGARQTGKSTVIREFGGSFELFLELNLEKRADLGLIRSCSDVDELLIALKTRHNLTRFPNKTLLFLDEIQESPEAVQMLRFFKEDHPELGVIAAGSLFEVRLQERGFSFPVGRTTFRTLYPFTFFEFLRARGMDVLGSKLWESLSTLKAVPHPLHDQAMALLREYILVGGMPEAVVQWVNTGLPAPVREVHADLAQAFSEDFQKYRGVRNMEHLEAAFDNLKHHYGTRFKYENFAPGFRSQPMKTALGRLEAALLITRVFPSNSLDLPLRTRPKSAPKLLPLDIGLALQMMGASVKELSSLPIDRLLDGRLAEIFVGQQLNATRNIGQELLHFWVRETARSNAEVDYLLPGPAKPVPVEIKSGTSGTLKSLHQFLFRSGLKQGIRLLPDNISDEQLAVTMDGRAMDYRLVSLPLYLAEGIRHLIDSLG